MGVFLNRNFNFFTHIPFNYRSTNYIRPKINLKTNRFRMNFNKIWPHLAALGIMLALACVFFAPAVFSGKVLSQSDNQQAKGMQSEIQSVLKSTGEAPLWTNSAFGGMPAYQIYQPVKSNLVRPFYYMTLLGQGVTSPWVAIFLAMASLYLLLMAFKTDWRVALVGAATYGISVYNCDILEAGHSTKMVALAFAPGIFAGAIWAWRGRFLLGSGILTLFLCFQMLSSHVQVTYYTMLILGIFWLISLGNSIMSGRLKHWAMFFASTAFAVLIGAASNANRLLPTNEYGEETIRGTSQLAAKAEKGNGLDKSYVFDLSCGISESFSLLVPRFAGGGSNESFKGTDTHKRVFGSIVSNMTQQGYPAATAKIQADRQVASLMYNGAQRGVGTAIYFGAALWFLFFLGAFLVRGVEKWWLIAGAFFAISLAWGDHFFLNNLFYDYLPMFKKFRAYTSAFGAGQLMVSCLAALGLQKIFDEDISKERKIKAVKYAFCVAAGLCVLAILGTFMGDFSGPNDDGFGKQNPDILKLLLADRPAIARMDAFRSLFFIALAAGLVWFYLKNTLKSAIAVSLIGLVTLADIWLVCTRTISGDKYETAKSAAAEPIPNQIDQQILADKDPHFRVLDLSRGGITGNATSSLFYKSLSGYHAAKMALYQDVVEKYLSSSMKFALPITGMLNGKYLITAADEKNPSRLITNPSALGNAWFIKKIIAVADADAELNGLANFNPRDSMLVQTKYLGDLGSWQYAGDTTDYIKLTTYSPDKMVYEYAAKSTSVAAFSEIYYPHEKGWNTYLNGQLMQDHIFKANYMIRGLKLPAGQKQVLEMRFEPQSVKTGNTITMITSAMSLLLFVAAMFFHFKNHGAANPNQLSEMPVLTEKKTSAADLKKKGK
jgi:hypothetical protein